MKMTPDFSLATIDKLEDERFARKDVSVYVLRLDKVDPIVSGNKYFKLRYFLEDAIQSKSKTLLTFGGAYSNHLAATALAGRQIGLSTVGIVRGEKPNKYSNTLLQCMDYGMDLHFVSRTEYSGNQNEDFIEGLKKQFGDFYLVPEGGYHPLGAKGAASIRQWIDTGMYTHIAMACGTATTLAGLLAEPEPNQRIIGIPVLKGMTDWDTRIEFLLGHRDTLHALDFWDDHHFGGYAKKNGFLIKFMNDCWKQFQLPLDFVYTAKMMHAVFEKIEQDHFSRRSRILCIHTGGLQGNGSLLKDTLFY